jgi:hypothetical protein
LGSTAIEQREAERQAATPLLVKLYERIMNLLYQAYEHMRSPAAKSTYEKNVYRAPFRSSLDASASEPRTSYPQLATPKMGKSKPATEHRENYYLHISVSTPSRWAFVKQVWMCA